MQQYCFLFAYFFFFSLGVSFFRLTVYIHSFISASFGSALFTLTLGFLFSLHSLYMPLYIFECFIVISTFLTRFFVSLGFSTYIIYNNNYTSSSTTSSTIDSSTRINNLGIRICNLVLLFLCLFLSCIFQSLYYLAAASALFPSSHTVSHDVFPGG